MARRGARPINRRSSYSSHRWENRLPALVAACIWIVVSVLGYTQAWHPYFAWLAGGTLATSLLFIFDKVRSRSAGGRVPEMALLTFVLVGGVIGGWIGMVVVHHKTRHRRFWVVQWLASLLHGAIAWWVWNS